jgi:hypothetical protein
VRMFERNHRPLIQEPFTRWKRSPDCSCGGSRNRVASDYSTAGFKCCPVASCIETLFWSFGGLGAWWPFWSYPPTFNIGSLKLADDVAVVVLKLNTSRMHHRKCWLSCRDTVSFEGSGVTAINSVVKTGASLPATNEKLRYNPLASAYYPKRGEAASPC